MSSLTSPPREPVSLFAFQDIVFSATAIMLLIAIFFAVSVRVSTFSAEPEQIRADKKIQQNDLDDIQTELARLTRQIALLETARAPATATLDDLENTATLAVRRMQQEEARWEALQKRIKALTLEEDSMLLLPGQDETLRQHVMLLVSKDWMDIEYARRPDLRRRLPGPLDAAALRRLFATLNPRENLLWIGVRPSGAPLFHLLRAEARAAGFAFGIEPVGEEHTVNFHTLEEALELLP